MEATQSSKLITEIPEVDVVITMGCNVVCPFVPNQHQEDWGLDDPSGKSDEEFKIIIDIIESKVKQLAERIKNKEIQIQ